MPPPRHTTKKPVRERDLKTTTYFLRVAGLVVPFLCLLGLYVGYVHWGLHGAVAGALGVGTAGLALSALIMYLLDAVGGAGGNLVSGRREAVWTPREQLHGLLSQARFNKGNGDYTIAFNTINRVLAEDPDFPEALVLKAQILWEGFSRADAALQFLDKVLSLDECDQMIFNQARLLHSDLSILENPPAGITPPEGVEIGLAARSKKGVQSLTSESYRELRERMQETPVAAWAVYASVIFGLFLICVLVSTQLQVQKLDQAEISMRQTVQSFDRSSLTHAQDMQRVEKRFQTLTATVRQIEKKLGPGK